MSRRILFADERGKFELDLFPSESAGSQIMLEFTPERPQTEHFPLTAQDARIIAAALMDYADMQDEVADTTTIPKVQDDDG